MEQIVQLTCQRCGQSWTPNIPNPVVCARCHSPYWKTPRRNGKRFAEVKQVVPDTVHTEPLMTGTPQVNTPQYGTQPPPPYMLPPINPIPTPEFYRQPPPTQIPPKYVFQTPQYPPPVVDYGQPANMYQEPPEDWKPQVIYTQPPVFKSEVQERDFQINPDRDMPSPLRKCKLCGYKGYGEYFKNHKCRR